MRTGALGGRCGRLDQRKRPPGSLRAKAALTLVLSAFKSLNVAPGASRNYFPSAARTVAAMFSASSP